MSKKRRRRRRRDDEQQEMGPSPAQGQARRLSRLEDGEQVLGLAPENRTARTMQEATLLEMQQQAGNTAVQRLVSGPTVQRQTDEEAAARQMSDEAPEREPYEFRTEAELREGGVLEMDLRPALDLSRYGLDTESDLRRAVKQWLGVGVVGLEEAAQQIREVKMAPDGRLTVQFDPGFVAHLAALAATGEPETEGVSELEQEKLTGRIGADVTATLHTSAADPEIADLELKHKHRIVGNGQQEGVFLQLNFETINFSTINEAFAEELTGVLLFSGEV